MSVKIIDICRPYFSRLRLYESLQKRDKGDKTPPQLGFYFSVNYRWRGGAVESTQVRDTDVLHLANPFSSEARDYLELILRARNKDLPARKKISQIISEDRKKLEAFTPELKGEWNEYIIPYFSPKEFAREEVGDKGFNLLRLVRLGFPVPAFCIISTQTKHLTFTEKERVWEEGLRSLELLTGKEFNHPDRPLILSIRSALNQNLPGLLPTYLNIGATHEALPGLIEMYGEEGAYDLRIHNAATLILDSDPVSYGPVLKKLFAQPPRNLHEKVILLQQLENIMEGSSYITFQQPEYQFNHFMKRIVEFYCRKEDLLETFVGKENTFPSIIIQEMVLGKLPNSYSGVFLSREPITGKERQLLMAPQTFGEEIMTGNVFPQMVEGTSHPLSADFMKLETVFRAPVSIEIAMERGMHACLQANELTLSGKVVFEVARKMLEEGKIQRKDLLNIIHPVHLKQIFAPRVILEDYVRPFARGTFVLEGEVCGRAYFSQEKALEAKARGEKVILVQQSFLPSDVEVMMDMDGLISLSPSAIHVSEVARRYGIVTIVGVEEDVQWDFLIISSNKRGVCAGRAVELPAVTEGELNSKKDAFWENFESIKKEIVALRTEEIESAERLADLIDILRFLGGNQRKTAMVNDWYKNNSESLAHYFLQASIGKHRPRINLFNLLKEENQAALIKILVKQIKAGRQRGVYILGRVLIAFEEQRGKEVYQKFIKTLTPEERKVAKTERKIAEEYLEISQVKTPAVGLNEILLPQRSTSINFERALEMYGPPKDTLTPEQIENLREAWESDPDPEHKPHKTIRGALARLGIKIK